MKATAPLQYIVAMACLHSLSRRKDESNLTPADSTHNYQGFWDAELVLTNEIDLAERRGAPMTEGLSQEGNRGQQDGEVKTDNHCNGC